MDDQDGVTQCDGKKCSSGSAGLPAMFHEHCIHNVSGALLCPECHARRMNRPKAKGRKKLWFDLFAQPPRALQLAVLLEAPM